MAITKRSKFDSLVKITEFLVYYISEQLPRKDVQMILEKDGSIVIRVLQKRSRNKLND